MAWESIGFLDCQLSSLFSDTDYRLQVLLWNISKEWVVWSGFTSKNGETKSGWPKATPLWFMIFSTWIFAWAWILIPKSLYANLRFKNLIPAHQNGLTGIRCSKTLWNPQTILYISEGALPQKYAKNAPIRLLENRHPPQRKKDQSIYNHKYNYLDMAWYIHPFAPSDWIARTIPPSVARRLMRGSGSAGQLQKEFAGNLPGPRCRKDREVRWKA